MSNKYNDKLLNLVLSAMFLALALVLPFLTGQIKEIGNMLLPMHIPVMLCGLVCGWQYGITIGFIAPLMRSALFGMPVMFPSAVSMAFELATYGLVIGLIFAKSKWHCIKSLYKSLLASMLCGRIVWCVVQTILLSIQGSAITVKMLFTASVVNAIPGIILQLVLIPSAMLLLKKTHLRHRKSVK